MKKTDNGSVTKEAAATSATVHGIEAPQPAAISDIAATSDNYLVSDALAALEVNSSESLSILRKIERNTAAGGAKGIGVAVEKAGMRATKRTRQQQVKTEKTTRQKTATAISTAIQAPKPQRQRQAETVKAAVVAIGGSKIKEQAVKPLNPKDKADEDRIATLNMAKAVGQAAERGVKNGMKTTARAVAKAANGARQADAPATPVKDPKSGRFVGKNGAVSGKPAEGEKSQSLFQTVKNIASQNKDDIKDAAGRSVFGSAYDAGVEAKDKAKEVKDDSKNESTTTGQMSKYIKGKFGIKDKQPDDGKSSADGKGESGGGAKPAAVATGKAAKEKTVKGKIVKEKKPSAKATRPATAKPSKKAAAAKAAAGGTVVAAGSSGGGIGGIIDTAIGTKLAEKSGGLLSKGKGAVVKAGGSIAKLAGPLLSGLTLPLAAAGAAAAYGLYQFGQALTTGKSDVSSFVDGLVKKVTGDKTATLGGKSYDTVQGVKNSLGFGPGLSVRDTIGKVESGNKGYGAYQNADKGIVSYGKYQFTADSGSLGTVLDKYAANGGKDADKAKQYSSIIKGGNKQQKEALRNDPQFKAMLDGAKNEKAMADAQEQTFDQNYFNPAMARGQKSGINIVKNQKVAGFLADTEVQAGGGGNQAVIDKAKKRLSTQGLDFKTASEEQQMQALVDSRKEYTMAVADKSDPKTAAMLRSSASSGGRIDQVAAALNSSKIDASSGYQAADAAKAGKKEADAQQYSDMQAKFIADQQGTAAPTIQKSKEIAKKREPAPVVTATTKTEKPTATTEEAKPVTAQGTTATEIPPTVAAVSATQSPLSIPQPVQPAPAPPVDIPALDKLAKANEDQQTQRKRDDDKLASAKPGIPNIKTDFDDTMLVLMSYDRI